MGTSSPPQPEFWNAAYAHSDTICTKLASIGRQDLVERLDECSRTELVITCLSCFKRSFVRNRCDSRWCPLCVPRLARRRRDELEFWTSTIMNPKHVILTQRNTATLTREHVRVFKSNLARLRRSTLCKGWKSGTWSLEVTNESRGWHLHAHLLVDGPWIDGGTLAEKWGRLVNQDYAIVKVKCAKKSDYLRELVKYVIKPAQLAKWSAEEIATFMDTFKRCRTFGVFGTLLGQRKQWKSLLKELRQKRSTCNCGSCDFKVEDSVAWETSGAKTTQPHAPPVRDPQAPQLQPVLGFSLVKV